MQSDKIKKYTAKEFLESSDESKEHSELWYGEIIDFAAPNEVHQTIVLGVASELRSFIKAKGGSCKPFAAPFDVVLGDDTVVQPDVMVICDPDKLDGKRCNGAPDLTVEVVSGDRKADFSVKLEMYKNSGVREYWIIDPESEKVLIYTFDDKKVKGLEFYSFDTPIPVGIFDGALKLVINEII
ncbi:Uma2 family endonuclease [uncultured Ruminococcus sp.]|uniref:Uma2 family endonuclease n=1 Tax=uncultured Ruminococcus sp. TaxID=165186 RepID=UPI0025D2D056|nr:Uma2 family endonuclease [uncultured Ruminococcus sp.]